MNYNEQCRRDFQTNKSSCVAWYLMASYAYYKQNESLLSDEVFDKMCKWMIENWDSIEHKHKGFINKESLSAGTGFDIEFNFFPQGLLRVINKLIGELK